MGKERANIAINQRGRFVEAYEKGKTFIAQSNSMRYKTMCLGSVLVHHMHTLHRQPAFLFLVSCSDRGDDKEAESEKVDIGSRL